MPKLTDLCRMVRGWEAGEHVPGERYRMLYSQAFGQTEAALFGHEAAEALTSGVPLPVARCDAADDELAVLELTRRIEASDVGPTTLEGLAAIVNRLCRQYPTTPPLELLDAIRKYRHYIAGLLDVRATLAQRRELVVTGGWLSLLAACVHEDLGQRRAAEVSWNAARRMGTHAAHGELVAWSYEIQAWTALLDGEYVDAVELSRTGLAHTNPISSAAAQLTAQQARAWARMQKSTETHRMLGQTSNIVGHLPSLEWPDHHFVFDPRKLTSYTATALAWLGDDSDDAEIYAREVIREQDEHGRPRRVATARIDLALVLAARGELEESGRLARLAIESGRIVPSNFWRVTELAHLLRDDGAAEIAAFREQYEDVRQVIKQIREPDES